ncbi:MAG: hypothetical protein IAE78_03195 [Myxococcus sp.]|nr:hypothetical protein [Myxococcus sp.]
MSESLGAEYYDEPSLSRQLSEFLDGGGITSYPLALLGLVLPLVGALLVIVSIVRGRGALASAIIVLGLVFGSFTLATLGESMKRSEAEAAIRGADPMDHPTLEVMAEFDSLALRMLATGANVLPAFLGCFLLGLGLSQKARFKASTTRQG